MEKYIYIRDISARPCYQNINARLLYLHIACNVELSTYSYCHSWRSLASELGMSYQNLRTALKQLEKDGLIATQQVTQQATYGATRKVTHKVTHIRLLKITELDEPANEPANSQANSQSNSQNNSQSNSIKTNNNNFKEERLSPTHARECAEELAAMAAEVLRLARQEADFLLGEFLKRKEIERKTWTDEGDLKAHFLAWCEKNLKTLPKRRKNSQSDDHAARMEEYAATEERTKEQTEEEKDIQSWRSMMQCAYECDEKGDGEKAASFLAYADEFCDKWGWKKMTIEEYKQKLKERRKRK
jgi:DNA-binding MarR family transcriptional regulator